MTTRNNKSAGRGVGLVVNVLAFFSDDPSSIPAVVYNFTVKLLLFLRTKINKKMPGWAIFKKTIKAQIEFGTKKINKYSGSNFIVIYDSRFVLLCAKYLVSITLEL